MCQQGVHIHWETLLIKHDTISLTAHGHSGILEKEKEINNGWVYIVYGVYCIAGWKIIFSEK